METGTSASTIEKRYGAGCHGQVQGVPARHSTTLIVVPHSSPVYLEDANQNDGEMPTDPRIPFGLRVRKLRQQKGLTLEKVSELSGLHATYLGEVERGIRNPALVSIVKIARGLNVTPARLFGDGRW